MSIILQNSKITTCRIQFCTQFCSRIGTPLEFCKSNPAVPDFLRDAHTVLIAELKYINVLVGFQILPAI